MMIWMKLMFEIMIMIEMKMLLEMDVLFMNGIKLEVMTYNGWR